MVEKTSTEQTAETLKETLPSKSAAIHELIRRHGEKNSDAKCLHSSGPR